MLGLQHPFSRGSVRLVSADPFDAPLADSALLRNPLDLHSWSKRLPHMCGVASMCRMLDLKFLVEAIKYTRQIVATSAFNQFNPAYANPPVNVTDLEHYVREYVTTFHHPSGTCKTRPFEESSVVNEKFRMHGVDGFRVVDPLHPYCIQASVYAVAEMVRPFAIPFIAGHGLKLSFFTGS